MSPIRSEDIFALHRIADILFSPPQNHARKSLTHLAVGSWSQTIPIVLTSALSLFSVSLRHRFLPSIESPGWENDMASIQGPVFLSLKIYPEELSASRSAASLPFCNHILAGAILLNGHRTWEKGFGFPFETLELLDTLNGKGPFALTKLILEIGSEMLCLSGASATLREARYILREELLSGRVAAAFLKTAGEAGLTAFGPLKDALVSGKKELLRYPSEGFLLTHSRERLNLLLNKEAQRGQRIGFRLLKETGSLIERNSALAEMLIHPPETSSIQKKEFLKAFIVQKDSPTYLPLILDRFSTSIKK